MAGCLSESELARFRQGVSSPLPDGVARHLAECARCQRLALFGTDRPRPARAWSPPSPKRALLMLALLAVVFALFLYSLQKLAGTLG